jgi:3,4-dihydroxy 2-butanone 4-phosphate synthase/GTP cyclohydrolase II
VKFSPVEEIIRDFNKGKLVIVTDDEKRENEGDLVMSASKVTPSAVNFMAKYGRGLICVPMTEDRLRYLRLSPMVHANADAYGTAFTVSVDAKKGVSTGISAHDRAQTIRVLIDPKTTSDEIACPGHIFPLMAKEGGILARAGHTEAAVDLAKLAGHYPAGVICEVLNENGTMARIPDLAKFARKHKLKVCSIAQLIEYRREKEKLIRRIAQTRLPTAFGIFKLVLYESATDKKNHVALLYGDIKKNDEILVRVHSECLTGDVFSSVRCDCGNQLKQAMKNIAKEGKGVILYMRQEGRGIGLANKMRAYELQDQGLDTVEANVSLGFMPDQREYGIGAQILADLGIRKIRIMTNNPRKLVGLEGFGLKIVARVPLKVKISEHSKKYMATKKAKLGHYL